MTAPSESEAESPAPVEEPMILSEKTVQVKASGEKVIEERQKVEIDVSVETKKKIETTVIEGKQTN